MKTKTYANNFDKSSSGTDIEVRAFLDGDTSRRNFEECIKIVQHSGYRTTSIGYYTGGCSQDHTDIKFTVKGEKAVKIAKLVELSSFDKEEIETWDDDTINTELIGYYEVTLIDYVLDKLDLIEGLEFVPNKNLIILTTRGYCQGDYAKVIYCPEDLEKEWGRMPDQNDIQKTVDHLYWDCPVYANATINGEEYSYWDQPEYDDYKWDREKFAAYVAEKSGVNVEAIKALLPEHLDYV